jgi:hypothetical protein
MGIRRKPGLPRSDEAVPGVNNAVVTFTGRGMKDSRHRAAACLVAIVVAGCSGIKTYPNTLPKNLYVTAKIDSGTVVDLDVHRLNARCETAHQGRLSLDSGAVDVGLPVDETTWLDFVFASKGFLSSSVSVTRYSTLLTPRAGYDYRAQVIYSKGIYDVRIREIRRGSSASREIDRVPLGACKARG